MDDNSFFPGTGNYYISKVVNIGGTATTTQLNSCLTNVPLWGYILVKDSGGPQLYQKIFNQTANKYEAQRVSLSGAATVNNQGAIIPIVGSGDYSKHSEIFNDYTNNKSNGNYSHAEGYSTNTQADYSFVGGKDSIITNWAPSSFVYGEGLIANAPNQYIFGRYNQESQGRGTTIILGNGTDNDNRRDSLVVSSYDDHTSFITDDNCYTSFSSNYFKISPTQDGNTNAIIINKNVIYGSNPRGEEEMADFSLGDAKHKWTDLYTTNIHNEGTIFTQTNIKQTSTGVTTPDNATYLYVQENTLTYTAQGKFCNKGFSGENKSDQILGGGDGNIVYSNKNLEKMFGATGWYKMAISFGTGYREYAIRVDKTKDDALSWLTSTQKSGLSIQYLYPLTNYVYSNSKTLEVDINTNKSLTLRTGITKDWILRLYIYRLPRIVAVQDESDGHEETS